MAILVGTASWADKSLIACKRFYPKGCNTAEARLVFYASQFAMVEVDSSYYALPSASNAQLWVQRTPPGFVFNVKAFRLFTGHQTLPSALPADMLAGLPATGRNILYYKDLPRPLLDALWQRFAVALAPLQHAGKLGAVHFQFAPWLLGNRAGHAHVQECVQRLHSLLPGCLAAVEFRHRSWLEPAAASATLAFLRGLGAVHVVVDEPQGFDNSVPAVWACTQPRLAILRLHGRNQAAWGLKGPAASMDRFDYHYSDTELAQLLPALHTLAQQARCVHVVFNNTVEDQGQRNARTLQRLLDAAPLHSAD